ncbi:hypothetical protein L1887_07533 [Cichorium endivia]|nr:hypothetical protein L1887_07533 [Cichorium endivia]
MGGGGRSPCCDKSKVKRGPWSPAEDVRLVSFIQKHGHSNWRSLPKQAVGIEQPHNEFSEISSSHNNDQKVIDSEEVALILVEDIDHSSTPSSTVSYNTHEQVYLEIPPESDVEFWDMLEDIQPIANDHDEAHTPNESMDIEYWVRLLEEELGLVGATPTSQQIDQNDLTKTNNTEMWCKISEEISPLWPTSPLNFGF